MGQILQEQACDLDIFFNLSDDILCVVNPIGEFQKINKRLTLQTGGAENLTDQSLYQYIHPDDIETVSRVLGSELESSGLKVEFAARLVGKCKSFTQFIWTSSLHEGLFYLQAKPPFPGLKVKNNPVKPDKNSDDCGINKENINEHRFKAMVQNGSDLVGILSSEGNYKYVSPSVTINLGHHPEFYIGKNAFDFIHPDDVGPLQTLFATVINQYTTRIPAYRFLNSAGEYRWLETTITNLLEDPEVNGLVANSKDVTELKIAENAREENRNRFENLIENYQEGFLTINRDWCVTSMNKSLLRLTFKMKGLKVGTNLLELFRDVKERKFFTEFNRAFEENTAVNFEEFSVINNRWLSVTAYPYENSLTVFVKDISELKIQQLTLTLEKEVLEMNAVSTFSLQQIADHLICGFEHIHRGLKISLSTVNSKQDRFYPLSLPSLPDIFELAKDGIALDSANGPCAICALNREEVYIQNVLTDARTAGFSSAFKEHGIISSRSIPITENGERVMAVLTAFNTLGNEVAGSEKDLMNRLGTIIKVLLTNFEAKREINGSNERYRLTMKATSDSIWDLDLKTNRLYRGDGFGTYHEQSEGIEPIEDRKWEANIHPDDSFRVQESLEQAIADPSANKWIEEYRYLKKDGSYAMVVDKGFIIRNKKGNAIRIVGALQDVTEIKKNQLKLMQSEEDYKILFSTNPNPMWTFELESRRFSMVNDAALKLYGYTREEFLQLSLFDIRIKEEHQRLREALESTAFADQQPLFNEWNHLKKDGTQIMVEVVSHMVELNGKRSRLVAIKDVTDQRRAQQKIIDQNTRLREIAQISSHETRKPLASILGLVSLFDKQDCQNPINREIIQFLEITSNDLDKVIHNIVKKTWKENEEFESGTSD